MHRLPPKRVTTQTTLSVSPADLSNESLRHARTEFLNGRQVQGLELTPGPSFAAVSEKWSLSCSLTPLDHAVQPVEARAVLLEAPQRLVISSVVTSGTLYLRRLIWDAVPGTPYLGRLIPHPSSLLAGAWSGFDTAVRTAFLTRLSGLSPSSSSPSSSIRGIVVGAR